MGYSIRQAAQAICVAPIRLSHWERDIRKPSIDNLVKLAVLYRVMVDELVFDLRQETAQTLDSRFGKSNDVQAKKIKEKPP